MLQTLASWLAPVVDWLSLWMPPWLATGIVYGVPCIAIGIPLSEAWTALTNRWWNQIGRTERRLVLILAFGGAILCARGYVTTESKMTFAGEIALVAALAVSAYTAFTKTAKSTSPYRLETRSETAPGLPVVNWRQEVDNGLQQKDLRNALEMYGMLWILIGGTLLGWIFNGVSGAGFGFFVACFFAPAANRNSTPPKLENVGGFVPVPGKWGERSPTELERRLDAEPITETWEGQAFITNSGGADLIEGTPIFVVQWRNIKTGAIACVCYVNWSDLSPFELDSSEKLFGNRGMPLQYKDPWIIATRSVDAVLMEIARDMAGQARLQHVFFTLSRHFGQERRTAFFLERAAERQRRGLDGPITKELPIGPDGVRQRPQL